MWSVLIAFGGIDIGISDSPCHYNLWRRGSSGRESIVLDCGSHHGQGNMEGIEKG